MKFKLLMMYTLVAASLFCISPANAETCEGGQIQTFDNHEYCQSNKAMNWWSAYTWCEAQGRHLATIYEICPEWDGAILSRTCTPIISSGYWTGTAYQTEKAITMSSSQVQTQSRTYTFLYAMCY